MSSKANKKQEELQARLKVEHYIGECIIIDFLDNTRQYGRLLAVNEEHLLINLMDEGFIEIVVRKQAIKHFFKYEI